MTSPLFSMTQLGNKGNDYPFASPTNALRTHDCNVVQTAMGLRFWSDDQIKPTAVELRAIGKDPSGGTGTVLASRCFQHFGMVAGQDFFRFNKQDFSLVRQYLNDGLYVVLFIDNGELNGIDGGQWSCALKFDGAHAVGASGRWRVDGKRMVWAYDACADGRRSPLVNGGQGGKYPLGRQAQPLRVYKQAAAAYAKSPEGIYLASGYAVKHP